MSKPDVWHDLAERIVAKLLSEGTISSFPEGGLLELVEQTIKEFVDERIVRAYFTKK